MKISRENETARHEPPAGTDFKPLVRKIPDVESGPEKQDFQDELTREIRRCCGNIACQGVASLVYSKGETPVAIKESFPKLLWLEAASIKCEAFDCPLDDSGACDREPRAPSPDPSTLSAELPL